MAAAVVFQLFILVAMILGRTVPYVGAQTCCCKSSRSIPATCSGGIM